MSFRWYYSTYGRTSVHHRAIAFAISTIALTVAGSAAADLPKLKGAYGFTGTAACLVAPGHDATSPHTNPTPGVALPNSGFKPNLQPNDAVPGGTQNSFARSFSVEGIRTFDGNGNGTVKGTVVGIVTRPTPGPGGFPTFPAIRQRGGFQLLVHLHGQWRRQLDLHHGAGQLHRNLHGRSAHRADRHGRRHPAGHAAWSRRTARR